VSGLLSEIQLLAWAHHGESPFIRTIAVSQSDADGSDIRVEMIPRSFWDADPRFLETYTDTDREQLRQFFDDASIRTTHFMHSLGHTPTASRELPSYHRAVWHLDDKLIPGVEIAEALATATKVEDLADAFAWFETAYPSDEAERLQGCCRT